jgi:hypothetical protein
MGDLVAKILQCARRVGRRSYAASDHHQRGASITSWRQCVFLAGRFLQNPFLATSAVLGILEELCILLEPGVEPATLGFP